MQEKTLAMRQKESMEGKYSRMLNQMSEVEAALRANREGITSLEKGVMDEIGNAVGKGVKKNALSMDERARVEAEAQRRGGELLSFSLLVFARYCWKIVFVFSPPFFYYSDF
jgi:hypothetical protein